MSAQAGWIDTWVRLYTSGQLRPFDEPFWPDKLAIVRLPWPPRNKQLFVEWVGDEQHDQLNLVLGPSVAEAFYTTPSGYMQFKSVPAPTVVSMLRTVGLSNLPTRERILVVASILDWAPIVHHYPEQDWSGVWWRNPPGGWQG